jgi:DNA polymerase-2
MPTITGHLFDYYEEPRDMVLWIIGDGGERVRMRHGFRPSFFVRGEEKLLRRFLKRVECSSVAEVAGPARRIDFWSGRPVPVVECTVTDLLGFPSALRQFGKSFPDLEFFNCDLLPAQHYAYATGLFPCARGRFTFDDANRLVSYEVDDDPWSTRYTLPDLVTMRLGGEGRIGSRGPALRSLTVECGDTAYEFTDESVDVLLSELNEILERYDPDLILSRGGDSFLFPFLLRTAAEREIELRLDREPVERRVVVHGRSYFSYGRILYQAPDYPLYGRWHLDTENSFLTGETGIGGLVEVARVSHLPVQRIGRRSIGTGITSVQLRLAYSEGVLIPWKKAQPEAWKSAWKLLRSDRGGLVYQPTLGFHEDVTEIDFVSMYPTIMSRFNVSPETVNCRCCRNEKVSEIGYTLCEKRRGLVARALEPILAKRSEYKARMKATDDETERNDLDERQSALKWLLVCCFGYLGYRNARFGRIEAHEAVCAISREKLLRAREVCEERGFTVLHSIVDCFWIHKRGATKEEIDDLCEAIREATELRIAVEGHYRWLNFLPSRVDPKKPVPNRFFGLFDDGNFKCRGIESRKRDTPRLVKKAQQDLLDLLSGAEDRESYAARLPEMLDCLREYARRLQNGEVTVEDLIMVKQISQKPEEYQKNSLVALAAKQTAAAGISIHPGEAVSFIVCNTRDRNPSQRVCIAPLVRPETPYDIDKYLELLCKAAETVLFPLGFQAETIREALGPVAHTRYWPKPTRRKKPPEKPAAAGSAGAKQRRLF